MPYIDKEKRDEYLVGFYLDRENLFLCCDCFNKSDHKVEDFEEIFSSELKEKDLYECDECGAKFEEE